MTELELQTRWTDFDALGHLTHAAYPVLLDEARDRFLQEVVGSFEQWPYVVVRIEVDYAREIRLPARVVVVRTGVVEVGRTSVTFEQDVREPGADVAAAARSVVVAWDETTRSARPIDEQTRSRLVG